MSCLIKNNYLFLGLIWFLAQVAQIVLLELARNAKGKQTAVEYENLPEFHHGNVKTFAPQFLLSAVIFGLCWFFHWGGWRCVAQYLMGGYVVFNVLIVFLGMENFLSWKLYGQPGAIFGTIKVSVYYIRRRQMQQCLTLGVLCVWLFFVFLRLEFLVAAYFLSAIAVRYYRLSKKTLKEKGTST